jgi:hypothetical protein
VCGALSYFFFGDAKFLIEKEDDQKEVVVSTTLKAAYTSSLRPHTLVA